MSVGEKILKYKEAVSKIRESRERGLKVILAQGVFDIVHIGHIEYFREAKKLGDVLFVGVENDDSVRINKGKKLPLNNIHDRLEFLTELESVDYVFGFVDEPVYKKDTAFDMYTQRFKDLKPNIIVASTSELTSHLELKKDQAKKAGIKIVVVDHGRKNSSTKLSKMIGY